ncbi:MAG: M18 family aminopeptidase [Corallococcus sp.]|nr:M18 family aminopeptidase [Corallococcus sp.]
MELTQFLKTSYTSYHATANCERILSSNGFSRLFDGMKWQLQEGGKYYIVKNDSSLIAFVVGDLTEYAFNIVESHTDSPALKVKGNTLIDSPEGKRINVETYGGGLLDSMTDVPLRIAGRIVADCDDKLVPMLVQSDYNVNIPSLCVHHSDAGDRTALKVQNDMLPLLGNAEDVYSTLTDEVVADADLYVVCDVEPSLCGARGEYLVAPRIDNLTSVFASLQAVCAANPKGIAVCACFDNEEIGSLTKQGARSAFLEQTLKRINNALGYGKTDYARAIANGFLVSSDNAHAVHPAHPEKSDIAQRVYLNGGVVIKHHVNYSTDGVSSAIVKTLLDRRGIEYQDYYNHSDVRCGSTIGLLSSAQLCINSCDVGLAQLAMHSATETVGAEDINKLSEFMRAFFDCSISVNYSGEIQIK